MTSARDAALAALGHAGTGPLRIGGVSAADLAARFGTPLYAHDAGALRDRVQAVRKAFGDRVGVLLALKANPLRALLEVALSAGAAGAEVASAGEVLVAATAANDGPMIQFAGPGKSTLDLETALRHGARLHLESEGEYERLVALLRTGGVGSERRVEVAIRVNPGVAQDGSRLRMADASSRFGIDRERVAALARRIDADGVCELVGLHVYGGSQSFEAAAWVATARDLCDLAAELDAARATPLRSLNFGGGFGWPVYGRDPSFDLESAGTGLLEVLDRARRAGAPDRTCYVELGRYLLAGGGVFLSRVVDLKDSGGRRHAVLDGGMHQFGAAAGLGAVMRRSFAIVAAADPLDEGAAKLSLGGPLCTPADRFATEVPMPDLQVGDLVAVLNAGAYGLTFSPARFLGHPSPAEVLVDADGARLVRRRGEPADVLADQLP